MIMDEQSAGDAFAERACEGLLERYRTDTGSLPENLRDFW